MLTKYKGSLVPLSLRSGVFVSSMFPCTLCLRNKRKQRPVSSVLWPTLKQQRQNKSGHNRKHSLFFFPQTPFFPPRHHYCEGPLFRSQRCEPRPQQCPIYPPLYLLPLSAPLCLYCAGCVWQLRDNSTTKNNRGGGLRKAADFFLWIWLPPLQSRMC